MLNNGLEPDNISLYFDNVTVKDIEAIRATIQLYNKYYTNAFKEHNNILTLNNPITALINGTKYLFIPDFTDDYPLHNKVIENFCKEFNNKNAQLILYLKKHNLEDNFNKLTNTLNKYDDYNVYIQLITEQEAPIEAIIANIDTLITGRNIDNLYNVELAEKYRIIMSFRKAALIMSRIVIGELYF